MPDRNIVTQVGIEDLKFALAEIAENLDAHINASLSKAHGIGLMQGFVDADGNDLTTYQDSNGDVIGNYFVRFVVNNVAYYAPAIATALPGQEATTGIVDTSADGEFEEQGGSSWVTSYTSDQVAQANAINNDVLLPHTRQPHEDTHGSITAVLQTTFSSLGHTVGTHIVQMRIGGNVYNIPASNRLGGPLQPPRIGGIPTNLSVEIGEGDPNDCDVPVTVPFLGGTKPVEYHWQYNNSAVWTDITPAASGSLALPGWDSGIDFQWADTSVPTFRITKVQPGSNETRSAQFRCRVTNAAVPDTGPNSGIITNTLTFTASDETGTWLCGVACDFGYISVEDYRTDAAWSAQHVDAATYAGYSLWAAPLAAWFRQHPFCFWPVGFFVCAWTREVCYRSGTKKSGSVIGKLVMKIGRPVCRLIGAAQAVVKLSTGRR
jgi:hypothetical protein